MATRIQVKRSDIARIKNITRSIGGYISGRKTDDYGIGRVFWNTLTSYLFQKIYEAYVIKSYGGTDELGNAWEPLAESTVGLKQRPTSALRSFRARERKSLGGLRSVRNQRRLIMRETDRLIKSLRPSIIRGMGYYSPREDQVVYQTKGKFTIGTNVEYAKYHNNTRPVIPDNAGEWVTEAIQEAVGQAKKRLIEAIR